MVKRDDFSFSVKSRQHCSHYDRIGNMNTNDKVTRQNLSGSEIDEIVVAQANNDLPMSITAKTW